MACDASADMALLNTLPIYDFVCINDDWIWGIFHIGRSDYYLADSIITIN